MKTIITAAALTVSGALAAVSLAGPASATATNAIGTANHATGAVFVETGNPAGNAIVAYDRQGDGSLIQAASYPAGGLGGALTGAVADHLSSQGALAYDKRSRLLYAVNAGSNTITMFAVVGDKLEHRQVVPSGGNFPVSITVHGNLVYVLNARDGGSIQGYLQLAGTLIPIPAWHRTLGLNPNQTPEFLGTPGQIAFTPDGRRLAVTTKNGANAIDVFRVGPLGLSAEPAVTSLPGTVPFALSFDAAGHLDLVEAGTNSVATFNVNRDGTLTQLDVSATGQTAVCWIATVNGKLLYTGNAGTSTVSGYSVSHGGTLSSLGATPTDAGTTDLTASSDGQDLYVRAGVASTIDAFQINSDGSLTPRGSVTVPDAVGGEGIVAP